MKKEHKQILWGLLIIGLIVGGYVAVTYFMKQKAIKDAENKVATNPALRMEAQRNATKNGTTLSAEITRVAQRIVA